MSELADIGKTKQDEWNYYLWECVTTHPEMRPLGRKQTEGCGHWNLRKTKMTIGEVAAQSKCAQCGRRKRLNINNLNIRLFTVKEFAQTAQEALNRGEEE